MADTLDAKLAYLDECVKKLPAADRRLLRLRYAAGATTKRVAELTGRSIHAIYRTMVRIHDELFHCVERRDGRGGPPMSGAVEQFSELRELLAALNDAGLSDEQDARLEQLVAEDVAARRYYLKTMFLYGKLRWMHRHGSLESESDEGNDECSVTNVVIDTSGYSPFSTPHSPLPDFFAVGGYPFACLCSAVIMGLAGLLAWSVAVTRYTEFAPRLLHRGRRPTARPERDLRQAGLKVMVGRITGMADCRWADPETAPRRGRRPLGPQVRLGLRPDGNHLRQRGQSHPPGAVHV